MASGSTILQRRAAQRTARLEEQRLGTRNKLACALRGLLPGQKLIVFGSLTRPAQFHERSDVDLALFSEPARMTIFGLIGELEERLARPVDVVVLDQCRFREKILREGELWTN